MYPSPGVRGALLGFRPRRARCDEVSAMSLISSFGANKGLTASSIMARK